MLYLIGIDFVFRQQHKISWVSLVLWKSTKLLYNSGSWGTVCNDNWDLNDARVVCRQLGCGTAVSVHQFAEGTGQIWLDEVACKGNETYLSDCSHSGFGVHNCNHSQDAGVICSGNVSFLLKVLVKTYSS